MASCPAEPDQTIHMLLVRRNEFVPLSPRDGAPRKNRRAHCLRVARRVGCFSAVLDFSRQPKSSPRPKSRLSALYRFLAPPPLAPYRSAAYLIFAAKPSHGPADRRLSPFSRRGLAGRAGALRGPVPLGTKPGGAGHRVLGFARRPADDLRGGAQRIVRRAQRRGARPALYA